MGFKFSPVLPYYCFLPPSAVFLGCSQGSENRGVGPVISNLDLWAEVLIKQCTLSSIKVSLSALESEGLV